jgi:pyruvyltransferase
MNRLLLAIVVSFWLEAMPLYWWEPDNGTQNFGDQLSVVLAERMLGSSVQKAAVGDRKILCIGSILHFAKDHDVVWGAGINGKHLNRNEYHFSSLDVRAVRGPLTRKVLQCFGVEAPAIYGDPGLLFARFFPEFQKNPIRDFLIVIHSSEEKRVVKNDHIVFATDPWPVVVQKIVESKFVISTSLHGLVIAESYGIPARLLRMTENEPLFKFRDYYLGTGREKFEYAKTIKQALRMGGEKPPICDLDRLLEVFPYTLFSKSP